MTRDLPILTTKMLEWQSMSFTDAIVLQVNFFFIEEILQVIS